MRKQITPFDIAEKAILLPEEVKPYDDKLQARETDPQTFTAGTNGTFRPTSASGAPDQEKVDED